MQWNIIFIKPVVNFSTNGPQGVCIHTRRCGWACHLNIPLQAQLFSQSYIQRALLGLQWYSLSGDFCIYGKFNMRSQLTLSCWGHEPILRSFPIYICCIDFGSLHLVDKYTTCFCSTFCQTCLLIFVFLNHNSQLTMIRTFHFVSHIGCCFHHSSPQWATLVVAWRTTSCSLSYKPLFGMIRTSGLNCKRIACAEAYA